MIYQVTFNVTRNVFPDVSARKAKFLTTKENVSLKQRVLVTFKEKSFSLAKMLKLEIARRGMYKGNWGYETHNKHIKWRTPPLLLCLFATTYILFYINFCISCKIWHKSIFSCFFFYCVVIRVKLTCSKEILNKIT